MVQSQFYRSVSVGEPFLDGSDGSKIGESSQETGHNFLKSHGLFTETRYRKYSILII